MAFEQAILLCAILGLNQFTANDAAGIQEQKCGEQHGGL
jgi:hypothetical protein